MPFLCVFATKDKEEDEMPQGALHFTNWSEVGERFIGNISDIDRDIVLYLHSLCCAPLKSTLGSLWLAEAKYSRSLCTCMWTALFYATSQRAAGDDIDTNVHISSRFDIETPSSPSLRTLPSSPPPGQTNFSHSAEMLARALLRSAAQWQLLPSVVTQ